MKRLAERFLCWFCHPDYVDEIQGDLEELYQRDWDQAKPFAQWKYWLRVLGLFRPSLMRSFSHYSLINPGMFRHYFTISTRVLLKHKLYATVNILGLAVGMGACLLIYQYIHFEMGFDQFHDNVENTYRLTLTDSKQGEKQSTSIYTTHGLGERCKETIPEIENCVRVQLQEIGPIVTNPEKNEPHQENAMWYVDSTFLQMFSFPLKNGDRKSALDGKYSIVLTEQMAAKYFGAGNPIGKTLKVSLNTLSGDFVVTGVLKDIPINSHLQFDFLVPMKFLLESYPPYQSGGGWRWHDFVTYITINERADPKEVSEKIEQLIATYHGEALAETNSSWDIGFQPVTDIHLKSDFPKELARNNGDIQNIRYFTIIAFFILVMAWVNYINLSTARAMHRAKEVGVRRSIGAQRWQLIGQFMAESFLVNTTAAILAIGIAFSLLSTLSLVIGKELTFSIVQDATFWQWFGLVMIIGILLSGIYPSLVLSSFKPIQVLKSAKIDAGRGFSLRRSLIVFQFLTSVLLIAGTYLVYQQIYFMRNQELGFDMEQVLVLKGPIAILEDLEAEGVTLGSKYQTFKNQLAVHHAISKVASSSQIPGKGYSGSYNTHKAGSPEDSYQQGSLVFVDTNFFDTYDVEILAKGILPQEIPMWEWTFVNEEALKAFGLGSPEDALQEKLVFFGDDTTNIAGVVKNFHWSSLKDPHVPMFFSLDDEYGVYFSIKMNVSDIQETIAHIESAYKSTFPNDPFYYFFLDDSFNQQYQADLQFGNLFSAFSALAVFIACIGLFALVSFSATLRTKEIGIRKVLGATVSHLMVLLSWEYLGLLLVAIIVAVPVIIVGGKAWLDNYAYKVGMGAGLFLIPALVLLVIALLTVSYRTYAAARANPVEALKTE